MTTLSERFKQVFEHYGHDSASIAPLAGVSRQAIDDIVNGKTKNPRSVIFRNLASKLNGLNRLWLEEGTGEMLLSADSLPEPVPNDFQAFIDSIGLTEEEKSNPKFIAIIQQASLFLIRKDLDIQSQKGQIAYLKKILGL